MPPKPWPIVVNSLYGDVPVNMFPAQDTSREMILLPMGGLQEVCQFPNCTELREGISWGSYMYWLAKRGSQSVLFRLAPNGTFAELGVIATSSSGPAWIRNNNSQLCVVDGVTGYVYTPATNHFDLITDADFPGAGGMDYQDGYGLMFQPNTNQWFFSAIQDFKQYDALDFYSKEAKTDNIRAIRSHLREVYIFGEKYGLEVWYNAGGDNSTSLNPTFARNTGGLVNYGSGAAKGDSDMCGTAVTWLSSEGQLIQAQGYAGKVVSNEMFDREVRGDGTAAFPGYSTFADAIAFSFRSMNHIFHQVTFPTANVTWLLDGTTGILCKRQSYMAAGGYGRHRANCYVWHENKHYVGDYENGKVYEMSSNYLDDDSHYIRRQLYSTEVAGGKQLISFPNVQVMVDAGMGLPGGGDPQIGLEFSSDGGRNWSNMVSRSAGLTGEYGRQANWNQLGSGYRRIYRLTMTDPIVWKVLGIDFGGQ